MAKETLLYPFADIRGRIDKKNKDGIIHRQKKYRDEQGHIVGEAHMEGYTLRNPRNYKVNPLQGEQLLNVSTFRQAVSIAKAERANPERLAYWTQRWHNQLKKGEPQAPIDPVTHKPRIYVRLDIFIQTVIQRELKAGTWTQQS